MNNIDWKAFETNMSLMLINMKLVLEFADFSHT